MTTRKDKTIIAVSAGQETPKKADNIINRHVRYLNYGLLGLVTLLKEQLGINIIMIQGNYDSPEMVLNKLCLSGLDIERDCECFLLSIPSVYSIPWCQKFCKLIKSCYGKKIIVGGRWVVDSNPTWIRSKLRFVDLIIEGFGERRLAELFQPVDKHIEIPSGESKVFDTLNYELLIDFLKYQPSIEVSRGCGSGCSFCADKNTKRLSNKPTNMIVKELDYLETLFDNFSVYFEAPHFNFQRDWVEEFYMRMLLRKVQPAWRCTTRVEAIPINQLEKLSKTGLKVLDIGLESASKKQLIAMKKTREPEKYLNIAEEILYECQRNNIWVKLNILLYAGETSQTVKETELWLLKHKNLIKSVSVGGLVYYKNMGNASELSALGASIPETENIEETGYAKLNLSPKINYKDAENIATEISRRIITKQNYFDVKSISYFERGYTFEQFEKDIEQCDKNSLPFAID